MQVILHGSFGHFPPDQLLTLFSTFGHSGALDVTCDERRARVYFEDGAVVHATSATATTTAEVLADLFVWPGGTFTFGSPVAMPEGVERATIDIAAVIRDGLARAAEWRSLMTLYPSEDVMLRVVDNPDQQAQINLTGDEFRILMKIGSGRTLRQVRAEMNRPAAELYPLVHRLESVGLVARDTPQESVQTVRNLDLPDGGEKTTVTPSLIKPIPKTTRASAIQVAPPEAAQPIEEAPKKKTNSGNTLLVGSLTLSNGAVFPLIDNAYLIGRDAKNDIPIHDASVSSQHAKISRSDNGFVIEDVKSRNGTFVNGEKITGPRPLADADVVRLGKIVLTFNMAKQVIAPEKTH